MVFSSLEFIFLYFAAAVLIYFITPLRFRNFALLIVSLIFYGWGEPVYVFLMVFTIIVNYICGWGVEKYKQQNKNNIAKLFVLAAVIICLSLLGFFKYANFFINNLKLIPVLSFIKPLNINLPIGISFYTFQTMSYTFDIYFGTAKAQKNITSFGTYVTFFPQLIAGPIVRYKDIDEQLRHRKESVAMFACGIRTFICGLCKKVLFANTAGAIWSYIKALPDGDITVVGAWLGILAFSFQIYFDFSGYSDMAIGLGKMFGFKFLENFNYPYISKSITEFWRRWHISLSTWFKEYVYIPLGGNRKGLLKQYRNITIVWFLTGFWHGAHWNYIIWGLYFGIILMLEKGFILNILKKAPGFVSHIYSLILIIFGWLIFTFEDTSKGMIFFKRMFGISSVRGFIDKGAVYDLLHYLPFFILAVIGSTPLPKKLFYKYFGDSNKLIRIATPVVSAVLFLICVAFLIDSRFNPFLYFRF
ncbi:MAG: MBOAT family protein [Oscillospiraceae bacterium]|nr:MBOAT family protein [Oscillospiraceae bacterium]